MGVELPSQASAIPLELDQIWHELSGSVSIKDIDEALGQERARSQRSAEKLRQLDQIFEEEHFPPPPPVTATTHSGPTQLPWAAGLPKAPEPELPLSTVPLHEAVPEEVEGGPTEPTLQALEEAPALPELPPRTEDVVVRRRLPRWALFAGGGVLGVVLVLVLALPRLLSQPPGDRPPEERPAPPLALAPPVKPVKAAPPKEAPPPPVKAAPPKEAPVKAAPPKEAQVKAPPPPPPVKAPPPPPPVQAASPKEATPPVKAAPPKEAPPPVKAAPERTQVAAPAPRPAPVKKDGSARQRRHDVARVKRRLERCSRSLRADDAVAQLGDSARLQLQLGRCAAQHRDYRKALGHYKAALTSEQLSTKAARRVRRTIARLEKKDTP